MSGGGYLTFQTSLRLAELGRGGDVKVQSLLIPMAKPFGGTESMIAFDDLAVTCWNAKMNHWAWAMYLGERGENDQLLLNWRVNSLEAPPELLAALPPAVVLVATQDVLRDEGRRLADKLRDAGKLVA